MLPTLARGKRKVDYCRGSRKAESKAQVLSTGRHYPSQSLSCLVSSHQAFPPFSTAAPNVCFTPHQDIVIVADTHSYSTVDVKLKFEVCLVQVMQPPVLEEKEPSEKLTVEAEPCTIYTKNKEKSDQVADATLGSCSYREDRELDADGCKLCMP